MRTFPKLGQDYEKSFPDTTKVIRENFYVDYLLTTPDSVPEAALLMRDLIQIMGMRGFTLRKWACSDLRAVSDNSSEFKSSELDAEVEDKWVKLVLESFERYTET
ncbi:hypothetical protein AVEN_145310-1 [Araneus ventricosus]|uniref:Uncharacterized protein n=1 Tax=Araneus ventricosus TaxID=182803 RepID=A0A4Y2X7W6_ARAVE|nr:hypothetical protein AVEN_229623-1 [Araneus ventricosus]GBO45286.1 hypothetical protein AVEN_145310-1 [Araneus ventricosus]